MRKVKRNIKYVVGGKEVHPSIPNDISIYLGDITHVRAILQMRIERHLRVMSTIRINSRNYG